MAAPHITRPELVEPQPQLELVRPTPETLGHSVLTALDGEVIDLSYFRPGEHDFAFTHIENRKHKLLITEPSARRPRSDTHTVAMLPGFTEMIDKGSALNLHAAVARRFTSSRIVSIATDGVGKDCGKLSWKAGLELNFNTMASDRLSILEALSQDGPVTMVNVSMGSVIGLKLAQQNLREHRIDIQHIINHSHAQVSPSKVPEDMAFRFLRHIYKENMGRGTEKAEVQHEQLLGAMCVAFTNPSSFIGNVLNLLRGTPLEDMYEVAAAIPTTYISGTEDPLAQPATLHSLQETFPENVRVHWLKGKGHRSFLDSEGTARVIAQAAKKHAAV